MKAILILIVLSTALFVVCKPATKPQKKVYVLSIAQNKITKARDTTVFWGKKHYRYVTAPVKLFNPFDDSLVYFSMTCSTFDIFITNNKNVEIELQPCEHNFPTHFNVPSHQSSITNVRFFFPKNTENNLRRFKIGMYLCKYPEMNDSEFLEYLAHNSWPKSFLIWSNEVTIKR